MPYSYTAARGSVRNRFRGYGGPRSDTTFPLASIGSPSLLNRQAAHSGVGGGGIMLPDQHLSGVIFLKKTPDK
jgi:hypothetical protein